MNKCILLIVNIHAGKSENGIHLETLIDNLSKEGFISCVVITQYPKHATEIVDTYGKNYDIIVCIGGDGTFNEALNGVIKKNIVMGYLPSGSVNDLAKSLNITQDIKKLIDNINKSKIQQIDIGDLNGKYFSYVAATGIFTKISYQTPQNLKNIFGRFAYYLEGLKNISDLQHSYHLTIKADEKLIEGDYIFTSISNAYFLGGVMPLNQSDISFTDGEFELTLIKKPKSPKDLHKIIIGLYNKDYDEDLISFVHAKRFEIISNDFLEWTIDGESAGRYNRVLINIHNKALKLLN